MPEGDGAKLEAEGRGDPGSRAARGWPECWLVPRLAESGDGLTCAGLSVGAGDAWACFLVGPGAGWQLAKEGFGLYRGFPEFQRQLPGLEVAGVAVTWSVRRGAGEVAWGDGTACGLLLPTSGRPGGPSSVGGGAPMTTWARCCIGLGSTPT